MDESGLTINDILLYISDLGEVAGLYWTKGWRRGSPPRDIHKSLINKALANYTHAPPHGFPHSRVSLRRP